MLNTCFKHFYKHKKILCSTNRQAGYVVNFLRKNRNGNSKPHKKIIKQSFPNQTHFKNRPGNSEPPRDMSHTDMPHADLSHTDMSYTDISRCFVLSSTAFREFTISATVFATSMARLSV